MLIFSLDKHIAEISVNAWRSSIGLPRKERDVLRTMEEAKAVGICALTTKLVGRKEQAETVWRTPGGEQNRFDLFVQRLFSHGNAGSEQKR